jgi:3-dehydroquinate dehydratase/shikimate dehydrogenase
MIKICAVIAAYSQNDLIDQVIKSKESCPDFIEIRLDYLTEDVDLKEVRDLTTTPLIATNRKKNEGGKIRQNEAARLDLLFEAARNSFDYVDVEFQNINISSIMNKINSIGAKTILSVHDFSSTPPLEDLMHKFKKMEDAGADVYKYVTKANAVEDNLKILRFINTMSKKRKVISFCMGQLGVSSRILSPMFGSFLTYASLEEGKETAAGQLSIGVLQQLYRIMKVY